MPKLALLDDRSSQRETIMRLLQSRLSNGWDCIVAPLLKQPKEYPGWLLGNDVRVLLVDHKLDEHSTEQKSLAVDYKAPEVIAAIRKAIPEFPIFILTAYPDDAELKQHLAEAEAVINRKNLAATPDVYITRMLRSANRFADQHQKELAELSDLAMASAIGKAKPQETERMKSLQATIGLGVDSVISTERSALLEELEQKMQKMEQLQKKIEKYLQSKK